MKNILTILVALVCLSSCHHKRQQQAEVEGITQEFIDSIIFHGYTTHMASARLEEDGSGYEWSEFEPYVVKYALYLAHGIVSVFSDSAQFHVIEEYMGKEVIDNSTCYNLATYDQNENLGYLRLCYQNDGGASQMFVDYPDTMIAYVLDEGYMPQETLERRLQRFASKQDEGEFIEE